MPPPFAKRLTIAEVQEDQLRRLLAALLPANPFYARRFDEAGTPRRLRAFRDFTLDIPFTTRAELVADQITQPPYGTNLTYPLERYTRWHQTSGTAGQPLGWLDTAESWDWLVRNCEEVLRTAGLTAADRVYFARSFGACLGSWVALTAAERLGCLCLPGGEGNPTARWHALLELGATVLCGTPAQAVRLGEAAAEEQTPMETSPVRIILTSGEPGGCLAATRARLEELWPGARVYDHYGLTEAGVVACECPVRPGVLHVLEAAYFAEVIDPATSLAVEPGQLGELVVTPLGRLGSPVLRYRTGDIVRPAVDRTCECGRQELALEGGILGRITDFPLASPPA